MSEQTGTFYAVSVGPGAPELLTLQAVRVLENTPVIAAPQTLSMPSAPPTLTQTPTTSHSSPFFITPISSAPEETFPLSVFLDFPVTAQSSPVKMSAPCTMSRAEAPLTGCR